MKFRVGRDALGEAVAFVSRALPSRPVVPLLSGILLAAAEQTLTLSCFDYEVSARVRVDADVSEQGTALVPGRLLAEMTRSLPARPVEFDADADVVSLTCGRAEFGLVCLPVQDYPALPVSPEVVGVVDGGVLASAVAQVVPAASRDDTLPMLTAVCLDLSGEVLTLVATDRYRLAASEVPFTPVRPAVRAVVLVPARILAEAARTLVPGVPVTLAFDTDHDERGDPGGQATGTGTGAGSGTGTGSGTGAGSGEYQPRPAEGLISFESADRRLTARLIAGEYIKYRARFPGEFGCRAEMPAAPLIEAVRRASLVAERAGPVRLSFRPDQVVIEAHAEGRARAAETVAAHFRGDQPVISFNPHYLLDGLTAAAAAEPPRPARSATAPPEHGSSAEHGGPAEHDGPAGGTGAATSAEADEPGRIRLEFTTPAKPALITWAGSEPGSGPASDSGADPEAGDGAVAPAFRYLVVPLRFPERG